MKSDPPVFAVTGEKDSGKTTMVTSIIERLTTEGYSTASIKHTKGEYSIDKEGTDTWKHGEAGAEVVVFSTPYETTISIKAERSLDEILEVLSKFDLDMVIVEGMKEEDIPGIYQSKGDNVDLDKVVERLCKKIELYKIEGELPGIDCGRCGHTSCNAMAEAKYSGLEVECSVESSVLLEIQGERIPLSTFPAEMLKGGIEGMLRSLKGVESLNDVVIKLDQEER